MQQSPSLYPRIFAALAVTVGVMGCSTSSAVVAPAGSSTVNEGDGGDSDARGDTEATPDAGNTKPECAGACQELTFTVTLYGKKITFERAQFGGSASRPYIELHQGGDPGCPTKMSRTPAYTLVLNLDTDGGKGTGAFFDFRGDVIPGGGAPFLKATSVEIGGASALGVDNVFTSLDATLEFADGAGSGHVYATYCPSLNP